MNLPVRKTIGSTRQPTDVIPLPYFHADHGRTCSRDLGPENYAFSEVTKTVSSIVTIPVHETVARTEASPTHMIHVTDMTTSPLTIPMPETFPLAEIHPLDVVLSTEVVPLHNPPTTPSLANPPSSTHGLPFTNVPHRPS